jgi:hypothetical protein
MKKSFLIILFILLKYGDLFAQNAQSNPKPTPPNTPLPGRMPKMSIWSIRETPIAGASPRPVSSNGEKEKSSPLLREIVVTKTWPVVHEVQVDGDGTHWDKWYKNGTQVTMSNRSKDPMICTSSAENVFYFKDYTQSDFNGFDWVSRKYYQDVVSVNGQDYFYYAAKIIYGPGREIHIASVDTKPGPDQTADDIRAYIDSKTLYPFRLIHGDRQIDYQFGEPPKNIQTLPANVQNALSELAAKAQKMSRKPPQGF